MAFDVSQFSNDGLTLLAEIASTKHLKIKQIFADSVYHEATDLEENVAWWESQTAATMAKIDANISAAGTIVTQARIIVGLSLKPLIETNVVVRTVVISACAVESGVETDEIIFCGVSDPDGVEVLYNPRIVVGTSVSFYFSFNNAATIEIATGIDPNFVTHSELDRYVTCHSLDSLTSGNNQDIYGNKMFKGNIGIDVDSDGALTFCYGGYNSPAFEIYPDENGIMTFSSSITDNEDGTSFDFTNYGRSIMRADVTNGDSAEESATVVFSDKIEVPEASISTLSSSNDQNQISVSALTVIPTVANNGLIGTSLMPFNEVNAEWYNGKHAWMATDVGNSDAEVKVLYSNPNTSEMTATTVCPNKLKFDLPDNHSGEILCYTDEDGFTFSINAESNEVVQITREKMSVNVPMITEAISTEGDIMPAFDVSVNLGDDAHRYSSIYAYNSYFNHTQCANLNASKLNVIALGVFPYTTRGPSASDADYPVGSIIIGAPVHFTYVEGTGYVPDARTSWTNITVQTQVGTVFTALGGTTLYRVFPCSLAWVNNGRNGTSTVDPTKQEWETDISGARNIPAQSVWVFLSKPTNYINDSTVIGDPALLMRVS